MNSRYLLTSLLLAVCVRSNKEIPCITVATPDNLEPILLFRFVDDQHQIQKDEI